MHLVESYATHCGLKIDEPYIYEQYVPIIFDNFVSCNFLQYSYGQEVIDLLSPQLEEQEIKILNITQKGAPKLRGCVEMRDLTVNEMAFILDKSRLHFGDNSVVSDVAACRGKETVTIHSNCFLNTFKNYWGKEESHTYIESNKQGNKPLFNMEEDSPVINSIKPEKIAKPILEKLGLPYTYPYETLVIGEFYKNSGITAVDVVPDREMVVRTKDCPYVIIRMDFKFDEQALVNQLQATPAEIVTDRPIDLNILSTFRKNIRAVFYLVPEDDSPEFAHGVLNASIPVVLASFLPEDKINEKKINYMEIDNIKAVDLSKARKAKELKDVDFNNLYYTSNKTIVHKNNLYPTEYAFRNNLPISEEGEICKVIDHEDLWKDAGFIRILRKVS